MPWYKTQVYLEYPNLLLLNQQAPRVPLELVQHQDICLILQDILLLTSLHRHRQPLELYHTARMDHLHPQVPELHLRIIITVPCLLQSLLRLLLMERQHLLQRPTRLALLRRMQFLPRTRMQHLLPTRSLRLIQFHLILEQELRRLALRTLQDLELLDTDIMRTLELLIQDTVQCRQYLRCLVVQSASIPLMHHLQSQVMDAPVTLGLPFTSLSLRVSLPSVE